MSDHPASAGLVAGIAGPELQAPEREMLAHPAVVGVILFSRNYRDPQQLETLCRELHGLRDPGLFVCVDQEGGRVQRFRDGFTALPALGALGRWYADHPGRALDMAYRHGRVMAAEVLGRGVDMSLAPVLDLDRGSQVIGDRAFGADPDTVAALAGYYLAGMRDAGMKSCGKHFPGHGSVAADTHDEIVTDPRPLDEMADDLAPFRALAGQLDAIMPAHVRYPALAPEPAGFSKRWIEYLRDDLAFGGVVISDDLDMAGAAPAGDIAARWRQCSAAGCDLALVCRPDSAQALISAVEPGPECFERARAAAAALAGRAAFTLDEQDLVPEFRAWKQSLSRLADDESTGGTRV
ncbi:MAG: beta-N-acetylhexosaminidase [Wenzhouxiangellaceae bacterium]|nr:beta-N-acetylhexosaminidase [Wenzhouxiangellaceae bacterium]